MSTTHLSQRLVIRFAQWAAANGGDVESATRLMDAARNHSHIIGARITALSKNSSLEFSEGLTDRMAGEFSESEIRALFTVGDDFEWTP